MGRKRVYASNSERQRAFQLNKKERLQAEMQKRLLVEGRSVDNKQAVLKVKELISKLYPKFTYEDFKTVFPVYRRLYYKLECEDRLPTDRETSKDLGCGLCFYDVETVFLNNNDKHCAKHGGYSVFLDVCPQCSGGPMYLAYAYHWDEFRELTKAEKTLEDMRLGRERSW